MSMFPQQGAQRLDYGYAETGERSRLVSQFFNQVYMWMAAGLMWTGVVSASFAYLPGLQVYLSSGMMMAAMLGAFVLSMAIGPVALRMSLGAAIGMFLLYATLIGVAIAPIWLVYNQGTIGMAFGLTGGIFFVMSLIGFVTKMDLSKVGAVAGMIAMGLFIGSIVNIFFASNGFSWLITYAVVIIFPVIIAWQTQDLKEFALAHGENGDLVSRMSIVGALTLYVAFLNIFLSLLRILGDRR